MVIYGRSDAVLNPGGVRIGTAEIYRQLEQVPGVLEGVAIGQAWQGDERIVPFSDHIIRVPAVPPLMQPLVSTVPLQVFACEMATAKGHDVDQPRNLAKSVTVE